MKTVRATRGQAVVLLAMLKDSSGTAYTSGTPTFTLEQDFGDFDAITVTGETGTWHSPPKGTVSNSDPRWIPGVDGSDGFNYSLVLPAALFDTIGTYFATITRGAAVESFRIHIQSGA